MKRRLVILQRILLPTLSVMVFLMAGWLWHRSFHIADYCYRLVPESTGSTLRGFGSYRGAVVLASVIDPLPAENRTGFRLEKFAMGEDHHDSPSMLKPIPAFYVKALGFGVSHGRLTLNLPMAWMLPTRAYQAVYIPYYFIMLLAAILPARWMWKRNSI